MNKKNIKGFMIVEILIVIAILSILSIAVFWFLQPDQFFKESRDTVRISDVKTVNKAINLGSSTSDVYLGDPNVVYISIPDDGPSPDRDKCADIAGLPDISPKVYSCKPTSTFRQVNGDGWIPVRFSDFDIKPPLVKLPVDPVNIASSGAYYTYVAVQGKWAITSSVESTAFSSGGSKDVVSTDGGTMSSRYEAGTDLQLTPVPIGPDWVARADMLEERFLPTSGVVRGKIYVIGGRSSSSSYLNTAEAYDFSTNSWTAKTSSPTPRYGAASATVDGKIYVMGGQKGGAGGGSGTCTNIVEEFDPSSGDGGTWTAKAPMLASSCSLAAATVNGKIYAIGGVVSTTNNKVQEYNPSTDTWKYRADMPTGRYALAASAANGKIYAIGGIGSPAKVEEFDPTTGPTGPDGQPMGTWATKATMPTPRAGPTTTVVNGKIYVIGGSQGGNPPTVYLKTVEVYDPLANTWVTRETNTGTARDGSVSALSPSGKIYVIGGRISVSGYLKTVEEYQ